MRCSEEGSGTLEQENISDMKACGESEEKRNHASDGSVITGKKKNANLNNAGRWKLVRPPTS
jgi:hypothetical protein